jgi:hypothetical protein
MINTLPANIFRALFAFTTNYKSLALRYFHAIDKQKLAATNGAIAAVIKSNIDSSQEIYYEFSSALDPSSGFQDAFIDGDESIDLATVLNGGEFPLTQAKFDELASHAIEDSVETFVNAKQLKRICESAIAVAEESNRAPCIRLKVPRDRKKAVLFSTPSGDWSAEGLLMPVEER